VVRAIKRFFLSRKTVLLLIVLILAAVMIAYIFPQLFFTSQEKLEEWRTSHPLWTLWVAKLGLDHVYTTPWFAALLSAFLFSLVLSTIEQIKISIKKTFGHGVLSGGKELKVNAPEDNIKNAIKRLGYFQIVRNGEVLRFIRHPWGYWGNVLFHFGIVLLITASLIVVLFEKRGLLFLVEGELYAPGTPWLVESNGIFAKPFILPEAVMLDHVSPEFWENDSLKDLKTTISFSDPQGKIKRYELGINQTVDFRGVRLYQDQRFGHAFFVTLTDKEGIRKGIILMIKNPVKRDKASYGNYQSEKILYLIKAKYFADSEKKNMASLNPLLVMRLVDKGTVIDEISLQSNESGKLGLYTARLEGITRWAGMIFVDVKGMPGVFAAFFIIIMGAALNYFVSPREFLLKADDGGFSITWKATRFESFYKEEFETILSEFGGKQST